MTATLPSVLLCVPTVRVVILHIFDVCLVAPVHTEEYLARSVDWRCQPQRTKLDGSEEILPITYCVMGDMRTEVDPKIFLSTQAFYLHSLNMYDVARSVVAGTGGLHLYKDILRLKLKRRKGPKTNDKMFKLFLEFVPNIVDIKAVNRIIDNCANMLAAHDSL